MSKWLCLPPMLLVGFGVSSSVQADEAARPTRLFSLGATAGTLGVGGEASILVDQSVALRGLVTDMDFNSSDLIAKFGGSSQDSVDPISMKGLFGAAIVDWHPGKSGWRLSAGMFYTNLQGSMDWNDGHQIGSQTYSAAQVGTIHVHAQPAKQIAPYLGFGYDTSHYISDGSQLTVSTELGALYTGTPEVSLTADKPGVISAADLSAEQDRLSQDLSKFYYFYPVVSVSVKLSF